VRVQKAGSQGLKPASPGHRLSTVTVADLSLRALAAPAVAEAADEDSARLVRLAQAGDLQAFGALLDRHGGTARRIASAALAGPEDADDVVQDASVTAWQKLGGLADPHAFRAWFLRITWRKALDRRRARRRWWARLLPAEDAAASLRETPAADPDPERRAIVGELDRALVVAIRSLPLRLRDPFLLATAQQLRYDDIARLLALPVGTVKWRVFEARRVLRGTLGASGHEVGDA
jgi:RNA polymerase sigma-70 factor (ECF subfamily)